VKKILTVSVATVALALVALPALAHVTVSPAEAAPDGFATLTFQVPHGCDGSATTSLSVQIPAGVVSVKPQVKPGWTIEIEEGTLPEPVDYFGETLTEGVLSVTWTGGPLDDAYMDTFAMSVKLPPEEGETLYFPAVQTCEEGETAWIEVPEEGQTEEDLESPAPALVLVAGAEGHSHGDEEEMDAEHEEEAMAEAEAEDSDDVLTIVALVLGAVGVVAGGTALATSRRRS
jgi:uncharacterized protein YcnI